MVKSVDCRLYDTRHDATALEQAEDAYSHSLLYSRQADPVSLTGVLVNLATVYEEKGQLAKAESTYQQAIAQWSLPREASEQSFAYAHYARAQYNLARLLFHQGVRTMAEKAVKTALEYDQKSECVLDLCRTVELFCMIEVEMAARKLSPTLPREMAEIGTILKRMARRASGFGIRELLQTQRFVKQNCAVVEAWTRLDAEWSSKSVPELCRIVDSELSKETPPFFLLKKIVARLVEHAWEGVERVELAGTVYNVTPADFKNWLLFVQIAALTKECQFSEIFALIQKYPGFLSLRSCLPSFTPLSLLHALNAAIQEHAHFPSTASSSLFDTPFSKSSFLVFKSKLRELLPAQQDSSDDDEIPAVARQKVLRGDSRLSGVLKRSNQDYADGGNRIAEFQPRKRRRFHRRQEDGDGGKEVSSRQVEAEVRPSVSFVEEEYPTRVTEVETHSPVPERVPISERAPLSETTPPSNQDTIEVSICAILAGMEQEYKELLSPTDARNRDFLVNLLTSRIRRDFVLDSHSDHCVGRDGENRPVIRQQRNSGFFSRSPAT